MKKKSNGSRRNKEDSKLKGSEVSSDSGEDEKELKVEEAGKKKKEREKEIGKKIRRFNDIKQKNE